MFKRKQSKKMAEVDAPAVVAEELDLSSDSEAGMSDEGEEVSSGKCTLI